MRGAFSAGSWLLLLALGCAGATTRNPDGSSSPGGASASGTAGSEPGGSSMAAGAGSAGSATECGCVIAEIAWWRDGGKAAPSREGHLTPCAQFAYFENSGEPGGSRSCTSTLERCVDAYEPDDVNRALADPDVQAALARAPVLFGSDPRLHDGHVDHIEVGGKVIELGDPCEQGPDCAIPSGVENFGTLLGYLQLQQLVTAACEVK